MSSGPLARGSISLRLYPHDTDPVSQVALLRAQSVMAVEAGYDGVMVSEHHADFPGYLPNPTQLAEMLLAVMPGGWAAPCPLLLPLKPVGLYAEELAWLAAAYPGRVGAGFAAGALPVDFEIAEVPFDEVVPRFRDALPQIAALLRGGGDGPVARDRALRRCVEHPVPMVAAAQSKAAVRRAAGLDMGVLYDSLQTAEVTRRLSDAYDEAGGTGAKILIRRVWIGDPPEAEMAAQMAHYHSYAPERAKQNWSGDQLVHGRTAEEAAEALLTVLEAGGCDAVNVRVHVKGLTPDQIARQLDLHAGGFVDLVRSNLPETPE